MERAREIACRVARAIVSSRGRLVEDYGNHPNVLFLVKDFQLLTIRIDLV
jgi:hypothetical protein